MFTLARHAEAGEKRSWLRADQERPLTAMGQRQAAGLAQSLAILKGPRLVSSPYLRCVQTLDPLAARLGTGVATDVRMIPHADTRGLTPQDDLFHDTVICTHGEVIAALLRRWSLEGVVTMPIPHSTIRKNSTAKGAAWMFVDDGDRVAGHYIRPLIVGAIADADT